MRKTFYAALTYMILGLLGGLYYRELTKSHDFTGTTQLGVLHTHLLTLGTIVLLLVLVLERSFQLSGNRWFTLFFWFYNAGIVVTTALMGVHGTLTVLGATTGAALAGISGIGHALLTVGLIFLFVSIHRAVIRVRDDQSATPPSIGH